MKSLIKSREKLLIFLLVMLIILTGLFLIIAKLQQKNYNLAKLQKIQQQTAALAEVKIDEDALYAKQSNYTRSGSPYKIDQYRQHAGVNSYTDTVKFVVTKLDNDERVYNLLQKKWPVTGHVHHYAEFIKGRLFLVKGVQNANVVGAEGEIMDLNSIPKDELWRFAEDKQSQLLYSAPVIDFKANPQDPSLIVVDKKEFGVDGLHTDSLVVLQDSIAQVKNISPRVWIHGLITRDNLPSTNKTNNNQLDIRLLDWSSDGTSLWAIIIVGQDAPKLYKFEDLLSGGIDMGKISYYGVIYNGVDIFNGDHSFNANTGQIVYSDFYNGFSLNEDRMAFRQPNSVVSLYVYDYNTKANKLIARSINKNFRPKWIDDQTIEYTDPDSEARVTYQLASQ